MKIGQLTMPRNKPVSTVANPKIVYDAQSGRPYVTVINSCRSWKSKLPSGENLKHIESKKGHFASLCLLLLSIIFLFPFLIIIIITIIIIIIMIRKGNITVLHEMQNNTLATSLNTPQSSLDYIWTHGHWVVQSETRVQTIKIYEY